MKGKILIVIAAIMFVCGNVSAKDYESTRSLSKRVTTPVTLCAIENKYGKVDITVWDKDEVLINVNIKISAGSKEKAEQIMSAINVNFSEDKTTLSAVTVIDLKNFSCNNMSIDYQVFVPSKTRLVINNKYGDCNALTPIPNEVSVSVKYGNVNFKELLSKTFRYQIDVGYGNINLLSVDKINVIMSYGNINTKGMIKDFILNSKYSNMYADNIGMMNFVSKYDKLNINGISSMSTGDGGVAYSDIKIGNLIDGLNLSSFRYGNLVVHNAADFKGEISVQQLDYSDVKIIGFANRYGNMNVDINGKYMDVSVGGKKSSNSDSFTINNSKTDAKISIVGKYSNIVL